MLCYLDNKTLSVIIDFNSIQKVREIFGRKADIEDRTDNLNHCANVFFSHFIVFLSAV